MSYNFSKPSSSRPNSPNNGVQLSRGLGADFWESLLQMQSNAARLQHQHEMDALQQYSRQYQSSSSSGPNSSSGSKKDTKNFARGKYADTNNNIGNEATRGNEGTQIRSVSKAKKPDKSVSFQENERIWTSSAPYPSVKVASPFSRSARVSTAPTSLQQHLTSLPSSSRNAKKAPKLEIQESTRTSSPKNRTISYTASRPSSASRDRVDNSSGPSSEEGKGNLNSFTKDAQIVLPRRKKASKHSSKRHSITSEGTPINVPASSSYGGHRSKSKDDPDWISKENLELKSQSRTLPSPSSSKGNTRPQSQEQKSITNSSAPVSAISLTGCLKRSNRSNTDNRPNSDGRNFRPFKPSTVTFAPGTISFERENKEPRKQKMKNNRKPKFAHPCSGHFLPPVTEIAVSNEPSTPFENPYAKFNTMWCGPMARVSKESVTKKAIRCKRFRNLLSSLSITHESFNSVHEKRKAHLMVSEILPRYIAALDIALMDGEMDHVEQLLTTIISSLAVLQINLHELFFDKNGRPKAIRTVQDDYFVDVGPIIFAMNRLAGDQIKYSPAQLSVEAIMVKLQMELMVLSCCPFECIIFRSQLAVAPNTAKLALGQLQEIKHHRTYYCVRWVNDSVMHRDYMSLLKFFGFCDEYGAKSPDSQIRTRGRRLNISSAALSSSMSNECNNNQNCGKKNNTRRPSSADPVLMS